MNEPNRSEAPGNVPWLVQKNMALDNMLVTVFYLNVMQSIIITLTVIRLVELKCTYNSYNDRCHEIKKIVLFNYTKISYHCKIPRDAKPGYSI